MLYRLKSILPQLVIALFGVFILFVIPSQIVPMSETEGVGPEFFPRLVAIVIIVLSLVSCVRNILKKSEQAAAEETIVPSEKNYKKTIFVLIGLVVWGFLLPFFGFIVTTYLGTLAFMLIIGNRSKWLLFLVPIIFTGVAYYLTVVMLQLSFPLGIFG